MKKKTIFLKILTIFLAALIPVNFSFAALAPTSIFKNGQFFYPDNNQYQNFDDGTRYLIKVKDSQVNAFQMKFYNFSKFGIKSIKPLFSQNKFKTIANGKFGNVFIINFNDENNIQDKLLKLMPFAEYIEPDIRVYPASSFFIQNSKRQYEPQSQKNIYQSAFSSLIGFGQRQIFSRIESEKGLAISSSSSIASYSTNIIRKNGKQSISVKSSSGAKLEEPNDTFYFSEWHLNNTGQRHWARNWYDLSLMLVQGTPDSDIDWPEAIAYLKGLQSSQIKIEKKSVIIADIGSGFDYTLSDLNGRLFTNYGEIPDNNIDDDNNGFIDDVHGWDFGNNDNDPYDRSGHDTHIAGTMSALINNSKGIAGVLDDFSVQILPIKFFADNGVAYYSDAIKSFIYAAEFGVDVINASWIGPDYNNINLLQEAINYAYDKGALIFAAAGNFFPQIDAKNVIPASLKNVIAVSATGDDDQLGEWYANFGKVVKILAPGDDILSTIPYWAYPYFENLQDQNEFYTPLTGTSMATGIVSASAALLKIFYPNKLDVLARLLYTTEPLDEDYGHELGGGRLNLYNAASANPYPVLNVEKIEINDFKNSDNDGILNQNETAWLKIYLKNNWETLRNIKATLEYGKEDDRQCVTILQDKGDYPDLKIGDVASEIDSRRPFEVFVKGECPDNKKVPMKLHITGIYKSGEEEVIFEKNLDFDLKISPTIQLKETFHLNEFIGGMTFGNLSKDYPNHFVAATIDGKILIINKDGKIEKSWQVYLPNQQPDEFFYTNQPALYDLDKNGTKEIIIGSRNGYLYVFDLEGKNLPGFPFRITPTHINYNPYNDIEWSTVEIRGEVLITDLDRDFSPEIIFGADNFKMYVLDRWGRVKKGWPIETEPGWTGYIPAVYKPYGFEGKPQAVDLDSDGLKEIISASVNGKIYIWRLNGEKFPGWPIEFKKGSAVLPIRSAVSVADIDKDGILDIVADSVIDLEVAAWDKFGNLKPGWPREVGYITGDQRESIPNLVEDIDNDGAKEIIHVVSDKAFVFKSGGENYNRKWPNQLLGEDIWGRTSSGKGSNWSVSNGQKVVGNIDRDKELEIIIQADAFLNWGVVFAYNHDGTPVSSELYPNTNGMIGRNGGGYVKPILADIDSDGKNEIITTSIWGRMLVFDTMGK